MDPQDKRVNEPFNSVKIW